MIFVYLVYSLVDSGVMMLVTERGKTENCSKNMPHPFWWDVICCWLCCSSPHNYENEDDSPSSLSCNPMIWRKLWVSQRNKKQKSQNSHINWLDAWCKSILMSCFSDPQWDGLVLHFRPFKHSGLTSIIEVLWPLWNTKVLSYECQTFQASLKGQLYFSF